jgi:hypothetical protein
MARGSTHYRACMTAAVLDLSTMKPSDLLGLYSQILTELNDRSVIWSRNAPAGDYAELLVAEAFNGTIAKSSKKSWDVRIGDRMVQVKCRVKDASSMKSQSYSPFRSFAFDSCIFVVLDSVTYEVVRGTEVVRDDVEKFARLSVWVAGSRVTVKQVDRIEGAADVTTQLRAAQVDVDIRGRLVSYDA